MNTGAQQKLLNASEVKRLAPGDMFKGIFIVFSVTKRTDKNGKTYWEITVSDNSGQLAAKVWSDAGWLDRSSQELEQRPDLLSEHQIFALKGRTVGVTGKVSDFRGQQQYNFSAISLLNQDRFPPARYIPASEIPLQVLMQRFTDLVDGCRQEVKDLLKTVFSGERLKAFTFLPAAVSNHHAYAYGLIEHTVTVTECAKAAAESYKGVYPSLDVDLVVAGALLHDLGKIVAYTMEPVPEVTLEGAVLDHIALGYSLFSRIAEELSLSASLRSQLGHIMLSHHGQKEFGSPILPATLEALIVSSADELDFRLFCWKDSIKDLGEEQQISAYHFSTQRRFWRPSPRPADD